MWLDLDWTYLTTTDAFSEGAVTRKVRQTVQKIFAGFESGSIQEIHLSDWAEDAGDAPRNALPFVAAWTERAVPNFSPPPLEPAVFIPIVMRGTPSGGFFIF